MKGYLITTITDMGLGIEKNKIRNVFKTFGDDYEPGESFSGEGKCSVGAGLSIAKTLTRALAGEIYLTSTKNIGTTITFSV